MTLNRKKSRPINVEGHSLRSIISTTRLDKDWNYKVNITIKSATGKGSPLVLEGLVTRDFWLDFPDISPNPNDYLEIKPSHIAGFIKDALNQGWQPEEAGPIIKLNISNEYLKNVILNK